MNTAPPSALFRTLLRVLLLFLLVLGIVLLYKYYLGPMSLAPLPFLAGLLCESGDTNSGGPR